MSELLELQWQQKGNDTIITVSKDNGENLNFLLEEKLINYLASNTPKIYVFHIELNNEKEKSYLVDFNLLKSMVSNANGLKIRHGKFKEPSKFAGLESKGKYCIARGDSYYEKHLNDSGWQNQRKYFELYEFSEAKTFVETINTEKKQFVPIVEEKIDEKIEIQQNTTIKQPENTNSKLKQCIKCNEVIPSKLNVCPYCKSSQTAKIEEDDDMIDISI